MGMSEGCPLTVQAVSSNSPVSAALHNNGAQFNRAPARKTEQEKTMKAKILEFVATLSVLLIVSASTAWSQLPATCGDYLLHGTYGFQVNGKIIPPGQTAFVKQQGVALQNFDGAGHFTAVDFIMTNGVPAINPATAVNSNGFRENESGTYTVNPDCTGSLTLNQDTKLNALTSQIQIKFVLVKGGKEIFEVVQSITAYPGGVETNVPATIIADGKKLALFDDRD
jgi:hypothetical protein